MRWRWQLPCRSVSATMAIGRLLGLVIDRSAVAIAQVGPERFHGDIEVQREAVFERIRERVGSARAERFITFMQQEMRNGSGDDGVINAVGRTSPLGQRLKGSQRAYHVRSTPMTGRNVATRRFFSLAPEPDSYALLTHPRHSQRWIRCAVREGRHDVGPGHYSPIYS
jgi:hypothetical protein